MAAGPADAFSATPRGFGCYDRELISAAADNLWSSSVVATASTGASWVDDVDVGVGGQPIHSQIQPPNTRPSGPLPGQSSPPIRSGTNPALTPLKKVEELRRKFHRGRQLQIKHLPREVTEEEIREMLAEWDVQSVSIQAGSARVALCSPELLEDWDRNAVFTLRGQRVTIVPSLTEMLLCVGRLPLSYSEQQFIALISNYGEVRRCFLMISERTGESKGYGFVEYVTKEAALQAKNALDGRQLLDFTAVCDWLDSSHVTLRSLHSKCLYVDQLPPNYRNMGEFRRIFSGIVNPPYCQIALKNGCPQDWGLVEFIGEDDAERTQQGLDGYILHGNRIRVAFYIPGVRAINLYLKLLNDGGNNKGKSALLPDPPAPAVFQQLQSLAKQNPVFAQNLQSIILQQIQDVQKGKGVGNQDQNQQGKRSPFQKVSSSPFSSSGNHQNNALKNAQQTALTLLLASQQMQNGGGGGGGGGGNSNGCGGGLSPNSSSALQNQQLLSALQAVSKGDPHFLNGIPMNNGPNNLSSLLGLAVPNGSNYSMGPLSPLDNDGSNGINSGSAGSSNIPHGFYPSSSGHSGNMHNVHNRDDQWATFNKSPRSNSSYNGSNGHHKGPLLPSPSGLHSPILDVPMDTGFNAPKTPPSDPLAVWYSLFGHSSPPDTGPSTPGNTSPLFMKQSSMSSNSSVGSPIGRSASETMFGISQQHKSSPPGFSTPNGNHSRAGSSGDLQEALNSLLSNPQNLSHLFGNGHGGGGSGNMSPPPQQCLPQQHHFSNQQQQQRGNGAFGETSGGMSNAILDLIMQSMKNDQQLQQQHQMQQQQQHHHQQQQQQQQQQGHHDVFGGGMNKHNSWSSGMSTPPSPIGNSRPYNGQNHPMAPQRSGSNGSSEMSGSSPHSPNYSPFSRNSQNKSLLESGNGSVSPTPTPWSNSVLGSPPRSHSGFGGSTNFQNRIWAPSVSPGNGNSSSSNGLLNPLGQKRKVHHESMCESDFLLVGSNSSVATSSGASSSTTSNHSTSHTMNSSLASHYADSYFKKKKKN